MEWRNHKCRIHRGLKINNMDALIMENEKLRIVILADKGTDIIEFLYKPKDMDFMFKSPRGLPEKEMFEAEKYDDAFQSSFEGCWQELFPLASGGGNYMGANFPFHGESFLRRWDYSIVCDTEDEISVLFTLRSKKLPLILQKKLTMRSNEACLYFDESVFNDSKIDMHFMWGHHPGFGGDFLDDSVVLHIPAKRVHHPNVSLPEPPLVSNSPENTRWPVMERWNKDDGTIDMSKVLPPESESRAMIILSELEKGEYLLFNNNKQVGFGMEWDLERMPYVWLWINYMGEKSFPWFGKAYAVAVEPFSSRVDDGVDSLNETIRNGTALEIKAGETISFKMKAYVSETDTMAGV